MTAELPPGLAIQKVDERIMTLNVGPQHPGSGHMRIIVQIDGDYIVACDPDPGYVHRGEEKMAEYRNYITNIPHLERPVIHDSCNVLYPYVLGVEELLGIEVPERAKYVRVICSELNRCIYTMYWLAIYGIFLGHSTMFMWPAGDRELLIDLMEKISGARVTHAHFVPGGVRNDLPPNFEEVCLRQVNYFEKRIKEYAAVFYDNPILISRTQDTGVLSREDAIRLGTTGSVLRASGVDYDLRQKEPYDVYEELDVHSNVMKEGDSYARSKVPWLDMMESCNIIRQALQKMPKSGSVRVKLKPNPKGKGLDSVYKRVESGRGSLGCHIVSDGKVEPYRLKMSVGSFRNLIALPYLLKGEKLGNMPSVYWSLNYWPVEADRYMSVIAPNFKLSGFIKSIIDDVVWFLLIFSLIGFPVIMMVLFFIPMPVIDGELLTPFLAFTYLADPTRTLPIVQAFMTTDMFKVMAFPGFGFAALLAAGTIFVERKMLAKLQLRVGPFYCGKVEGILQLAGDGLKLISKEIIIPAKADKPIFWAAPVLFVASAAAFVALIPVAPGWVVADVDLGLLGVFAVIGFFPIVTILSAWSANSKFPFIGGIRALFQMVSFEIPLILSLLGVVMVTGTLNLSEIAASQSSFPWIVFLPVGAIVFFITMLAELERIPFDLPEAESEIVAGWLTELSGMMYGLVQLGTYLKLYAFAALFVVLFLGGWNGPMIVPPFPMELATEGIELGPVTAKIGGLEPLLTQVITQEMLNGTLMFVLKTVGVIFFILLPRGVFPRIRVDMLLNLGWTKLIGLAFVNIFIALALVYAGVLGPGGLQ